MCGWGVGVGALLGPEGTGPAVYPHCGVGGRWCFPLVVPGFSRLVYQPFLLPPDRAGGWGWWWRG